MTTSAQSPLDPGAGAVGLVVPAFRESGRLPRFLPGLVGAVAAHSGSSRVLVVDDGSGAAEQAKIGALCAGIAADRPALLPPLLLEKNAGKGGAIRAGWDALAAQNFEWLGFVDADGSCPAGEVARLLAEADRADSGTACLAASRIKMLGRKIERSPLRHIVGRVFATLVGTFLKIPVYDSQCGLKLIRTRAYLEVRARLAESGFAFDVDLLVALWMAGADVREIPIDWSDVPGGKVSLVRDSLRMLRAVVAIRRRMDSL